MRIDVDRTLKILLTIILAAVVAYFGWQVVQRVLYPLEMFLMGAIIAFILSPAVDYLNYRNGFPRPLAILVVYTVILLLLSILGYFLVSPLLNQIQTLTNDLPKRFAELQPKLHNLDAWLTKNNLPTSNKLQGQATTYLSSVSTTIINNLSILVLTSFNFLVNIVLVLVIAFYLLLDGDNLVVRVYDLIPRSQVERVGFVQATINTVLGGYLRGQLVMALTIGSMAGVGVYAIGMHQYAVVVGVLAGILEMVPMLGPWLASMPAILISAFTPDWWPRTLIVGLYFLLIQQLESNVIGPRITGRAVGLHPLAALMALLVGIELDGILGALFAVPVAGILYVLGMAIYYDLTGRPQPELQRKSPPSGKLLPSFHLSARLPLLGLYAERDDGRHARLPSLRLRRPGAPSAVPQRLADIEAKRDHILRDKLQPRVDAERRNAEEQEGARNEDAPASPPAEKEQDRRPDEVGAHR